MLFHKNKCSLCGSFVNINNATICPGCNSNIYWAPSIDDSNEYVYYPSKNEADEAFEHARKLNEKRDEIAFVMGAILAFAGLLIWGLLAGFSTTFLGCLGIVILVVGVSVAWLSS